jgi:cytochrome P450
MACTKPASLWEPLPIVKEAATRFIREYESNGVPKWVENFHSPLNDLPIAEVMKDYMHDAFILNLQRYAAKYLDDGLGIMVIPNLYYVDEVPTFKPCLYVSSPAEVLRLGRTHVSKDRELSLFESKHVVNHPNKDDWRRQRRHMMDAFLPLGPIQSFVPTLDEMACTMCDKWNGFAQRRPVLLDVRAWMHHTALAMFIRCMIGDDRAYSRLPDIAPGKKVQIMVKYEDDLKFGESTPEHSSIPRSLFNLESIGPQTNKRREARVEKMGLYIFKFIDRGVKKLKRNERVGPLFERILELKDDEEKFQNMAATLIAGHDTTAYTMQFCLFELSRNPRFQHRAREECCRILDAIEEEGRSMELSDIPKFEFLTKCICETLRFWNVASLVFPRVFAYDDELPGRHASTTKLAQGSKFSFWYYGQHHSKQLWGDDAMDFNPDREWRKEELQLSTNPAAITQGIAMTPCTERFHPFSVPTRDCMGKNFALTEMRILLPRILRHFHLEVPDGSDLLKVKPVYTDPVYAKWAREIGGPPQAHKMMLRVIPNGTMGKM